jgi:hypothetical protein
MANQLSGQSGPSPRCYSQHQRHRRFARVGNGANQFSAYLAAQATRLTSTSSAVFGKLSKYKAKTVTAAANLAAIP